MRTEAIGVRLARPLRTREARDLLEEVDAAVQAIASSFHASEEAYPALIDRETLVRAEYPDAFPHLLMTVDTAQPSAWCLSPAVCYHTYSRLAGCRVSEGIAITARGLCFRSESSTSPGIRQVEFEMREIVFAGARAWVEPRAEAAQARIGELARRLGLEGGWDAAEDPFFLPASRGKALLQRLKVLKLEYRSADADALALASLNRHHTFFGERFGMLDATGAPVHTACIAVGLDRWCARLLDRRTAAAVSRSARCDG